MIFRGDRRDSGWKEGGPWLEFSPAQYAQGIVFLQAGDTMVLFTKESARR